MNYKCNMSLFIKKLECKKIKNNLQIDRRSLKKINKKIEKKKINGVYL